MFAPAIVLAASLMWSATAMAQTAGTPLSLEGKIPLGAVSGRIDHLGIDESGSGCLLPSSATTASGWSIWQPASDAHETGTQVFVNVPDAREISVVDLAAGSTLSLPTQGAAKTHIISECYEVTP